MDEPTASETQLYVVERTCSNTGAGVSADVGACAGVLDAGAGANAASQRVYRRNLMFFHGARL